MALFQTQIPGGAYVNVTNSRQEQIPGWQYINQDATSAPGHTLKTVLGIVTASLATINGTVIGSVKTYLGLTP